VSLSDLAERIYQAQCIGNVEPVEHMVPYPDLASVAEGSTIKYADRLLYLDLGLTNGEFWQRIRQTAQRLYRAGIRSGDRIALGNLPSPWAEIAAFSTWYLGAVLIVGEAGDLETMVTELQPRLTITDSPDFFPASEESTPADFTSPGRPLITAEALIDWNCGRPVRLSHYNLLVNANSLVRALGLDPGTRLRVQLPPTSAGWAVVQALLPSIAGVQLTHRQPDLTIGLPGQFDHADYLIVGHWDALRTDDPPRLYALPEAGGILAVNETPLHLLNVEVRESELWIQGHSVMMGYLDRAANETAFRQGKLIVKPPGK
jgi:acyl-CoA synthetase (AMP-forming)/AMP-acid ligase II